MQTFTLSLPLYGLQFINSSSVYCLCVCERERERERHIRQATAIIIDAIIDQDEMKLKSPPRGTLVCHRDQDLNTNNMEGEDPVSCDCMVSSLITAGRYACVRGVVKCDWKSV